MRDLDRIRERDDDDAPARKLAMLVMAALATVGLVFAMGVLLRDGAATEAPDEDPLARLDALDRGAAAPPLADQDTVEEDDPELTFHASLTQAKSPELAAAIAAADAELAALEGEGELHPARSVALALQESPEPEAVEPVAPPRARRAVPVVAANEDGEPGRAGYALQVASYKNPREAETFAKELERRSHPVFVERAVIEGRGEFHRVRVGPFETRGEAIRHRARFEETERIHTLLVKL